MQVNRHACQNLAGLIEREYGWEVLERVKGFEPSTPTLARLCSTPELHPHRWTVIKGTDKVFKGKKQVAEF